MQTGKPVILIRYFVIALLILLTVVQAFYGYFIMAAYYLHANEYASECINKARPQMHCNGKCRMYRQLADDDDKNKHAPVIKIEIKMEASNFTGIFKMVPVICPNSKLCYINYTEEITPGNVSNLFRPPQRYIV